MEKLTTHQNRHQQQSNNQNSSSGGDSITTTSSSRSLSTRKTQEDPITLDTIASEWHLTPLPCPNNDDNGDIGKSPPSEDGNNFAQHLTKDDEDGEIEEENDNEVLELCSIFTKNVFDEKTLRKNDSVGDDDNDAILAKETSEDYKTEEEEPPPQNEKEHSDMAI